MAETFDAIVKLKLIELGEIELASKWTEEFRHYMTNIKRSMTSTYCFEQDEKIRNILEDIIGVAIVNWIQFHKEKDDVI